MRRSVHFSGLAIGLLLLAVGAAAARPLASPPPSTRSARLHTILSAIVATSGAPGAVLLVETPKATLRGTKGLARKSPLRAMRPTTRFRIGSIIKTFVAAVTLDLVEKGTLSLDDTLEKWLPGRLPNGAGAKITVRQLLGHRSGIVEPLGSGIQIQAPGTFSYANTNYALLMAIVAAATSSTFQEQLTQLILGPLQLSHTELRAPDTPVDVAHGYSPDGSLDVTSLPAPIEAGLISTADDLARFERALLQGRLIAPDLVAAMETPGSLNGFDRAGYNAYGLGLMRFPATCGAAWGHRGQMEGYTSWMLSTASGSRTVVLLLNSGLLPRPKIIALNKLVTRALCT